MSVSSPCIWLQFLTLDWYCSPGERASISRGWSSSCGTKKLGAVRPRGPHTLSQVFISPTFAHSALVWTVSMRQQQQGMVSPAYCWLCAEGVGTRVGGLLSGCHVNLPLRAHGSPPQAETAARIPHIAPAMRGRRLFSGCTWSVLYQRPGAVS